MEWQWIVAILLYVNTVEGLESNDSCQSKEIDSSSSLEKEMNRLQGIHDEYCSKVVLKPGSYTIKTTFVLNNSNISIRGNSSYAPVSITFELGEGIAPLYYLLFRNSNMVEITGIHFENSPGIIGFESVDKVIIRDSTFRWFSQGAVDIFQSLWVNVTNCSFEHNGPVYILRNDRYRGHAAGLSIGYNIPHLSSQMGQVIVKNCTFRNNTSDPEANPVYLEPNRPHEIFRGFVFSGRGGGLAITLNSSFPFSVSIDDCIVEENRAQAFGGGMYLLFGAYVAHTMKMNNTRFTNNKSGRGGGLSLAALEGVKDDLTWAIADSHFENNHANLGGGIFIHIARVVSRFEEPSTILTVQNGTFVKNICNRSGAALSVSSQLLHASAETIPRIQFEDCDFYYNDGKSGGVITSGYIPLIFQGNNNFIRNEGRVLVAIGRKIYVRGSMLFMENNGGSFDGGAVYTASFSKLKLDQGANISFIDNRGVTGAGLVVSNMAALFLPPVYRYTQFNPLCVFQYDDRYKPPSEWTNVSVIFSGNEARTGSAILTSGIDLCSYPDFQNLSNVFRWNFLTFENNSNTAHGSSSSSSTWFVETLPQRIEVKDKLVVAYPGKKIKVKFLGFDELQRPTSSIIRLSHNDILFSPNVAVSRLISNATLETEILFLISNGTEETEILHKKIKTPFIATVHVESLFAEITSTDYFQVEIHPCPIGFEEHQYERNGRYFLTCRCATQSNLNIRACDGRNVLIKEGLWAIGYQNNKTGGHSLDTYQCPSGYCRCFHSDRFLFQSCVSIFRIEEADIQCQCNREGILCGNCRNDTGFTALLNNCKECDSVNILIIIVLILVDVFVIGILLMVKIGPPSWSYPILFYAQITPYLVERFPYNFYSIQTYGHYFSNGLSLYLVYDFCILPNMDAHIAYLLRYIPFIITLLMGTIVIIFRMCYKMSRIPWFGLWWVIILQYSHIVHTSMTILNCPSLPNQQGDVAPRWYVNANIECYHGFHLFLALLAIATLIFCVVLIPVILLYTLRCVQRPLLLQSSILSTAANFRKEYPYWSAMELIRRLVVVFLAIISPHDYPLTMYFGLSIVVCLFVLPYKHHPVNYLDAALTINTFLLLTQRHINLEESLTSTSDFESHFNFSCGHKSKTIEPITQRLVAFYYFPYAALLLTLLIAAIFSLTRRLKHRKKDSKADVEPDHLNSSYQLYSPDITMHVMEDLPQNAVPLSTIHNLNRDLTTSLLEDELDTRSSEHPVKVHSSLQRFSRRKAMTTVKQYKSYFKKTIRLPRRTVHGLTTDKKQKPTTDSQTQRNEYEETTRL